MADNIRFLDQNVISSTSTSTGGAISVYSASQDLGIVTVLDFTGSGITNITNTSGIALIDISGAVGPSGSSGPSGSAGPSGSEGSLAQWRYSSSIDTGTDPGAGYFRLDTTWNSALTSKLSIDDVSYNPTVNFGTLLNSITPNTIVKLFSPTDSTIYKYLQITSIAPNQPGYEVYDVTDLGSNGSPSNEDPIGISLPSPGANALEVLYTSSVVVGAATSLNFTGSGFSVTDAGGGAVNIYNTLIVDTGSLLVTASVVDATTTYTKGDGSTFTTLINNVSASISSSHALYADTATSAFTASIRYETASGDTFSLSNIQVNDYDPNVAVTFTNGKLTFTFGTPETPSSIAASLSGFITDRFNQETDNYTVNANWDNGGYILISSSLYEGSTLLQQVGSGTSLSYNTTTSGSHTYVLQYTASSPLDSSLYETTANSTGNLSKTNPNNPSISSTPTVQLGYTSNQIEQGATGSIVFSKSYGSDNGWEEVSLTSSPTTSPIFVTGSATGSSSIVIGSTSNYQSPSGENSPQIFSVRNSTTTYSKIRSVRYGASANSSFTQAELEVLSDWDTTLGGTIGTIAKGNTNPSGDAVTITWSGDKYQYIVYNSSLSNLTSITTSGFEVLGQFSVTTVGGYKVYRTTTLQSGGGGTSITYNLT